MYLQKQLRLPPIWAVKLTAVFFAVTLSVSSLSATIAQAANNKTVANLAPNFSKSASRHITSKNKTRALRPPARKIPHQIKRHSGSFRSLHPRLRALLARVERHYGKPVVLSSGCRSHRHNRQIGGARKSLHLRCMAADFKVPGVSKARLRRYVATLSGRGGVGTYCGRSIVHLDVGPRRTWYYGCRKRRRR